MYSDKGRSSVTVAHFFEVGRHDLDLEVAHGAEWLETRIIEPALNRPGLALTGFYKHFAHKRVQVIGWAEHSYISSLNDEDRRASLTGLFAQKIPCLVMTRRQKIFPEIFDLSKKRKVAILRSKMVTRHFINAGTIIMKNLAAPSVNAQGTMVEIMGVGVLIEGKPGMGKSESALGLIKKGHALVSDDITNLRLDSSGNIIGTPVDITRYHMEIRGLGIIHVPSLFGVSSVREDKRLDLIVTLCNQGTHEEEDRSGQTPKFQDIFGVKIPRLYIPVAPGRDLANVIETAALDFKLKRLGHDAIKELDLRLVNRMSRGREASD